MALTAPERDALIGDWLATRFPQVPPEQVRKITQWALLMNCAEQEDDLLVQRWREVPLELRSHTSKEAVARHYARALA